MVSNYNRAIQLPFSITMQGKVASTTDPNKIWADRVLGALGTALGERIGNSTYGSNVANFMFDTFSDTEVIFKRDVESIFSTYLPELELDTVDFSIDEKEGIISANVSYFLPNRDESNIALGIAKISGNNQIVSKEK